MPDKALPIDQARRELIRRFEACDWRVTERAERDGKAILQREQLAATQCGVVDYVLRLLKSEYPMHSIERGSPVGSLPSGYVMNNSDGRGLYIELVLESGLAWIISFHTSKHSLGS